MLCCCYIYMISFHARRSVKTLVSERFVHTLELDWLKEKKDIIYDLTVKYTSIISRLQHINIYKYTWITWVEYHYCIHVLCRRSEKGAKCIQSSSSDSISVDKQRALLTFSLFATLVMMVYLDWNEWSIVYHSERRGWKWKKERRGE